MTRRADWQARLGQYLADCGARAYAPGRFDCALFAAGAVEAMTGQDFAAHWAGRYRSLRGGVRVLRAEGYADHIALVGAHFAAIPPALAGIGDLAVADGPQGRALGVVLGPVAAFLRQDRGLDHLPLTQLVGAFRV